MDYSGQNVEPHQKMHQTASEAEPGRQVPLRSELA